MSTASRDNTHHVAVGLCILALGLVLALDRLGTLSAEEAFRYWPLALVVVGVSVIAQASRPDVRASVPWGSIVWILIIGFTLSHVFERRSDTAAANGGGETMSIFAVLTGAQRTATADVTGARITTLLGGAELDLRTARPAPGGEVVVDLFTLMGGAVIYAPETWTVDVQATSLMGGISDERGQPERRSRRRRGEDDDNREAPPPVASPAAASADSVPGDGGTPRESAAPGDDVPIEAADPPTAAKPPRLVIRGFVAMGGVAIKSR